MADLVTVHCTECGHSRDVNIASLLAKREQTRDGGPNGSSQIRFRCSKCGARGSVLNPTPSVPSIRISDGSEAGSSTKRGDRQPSGKPKKQHPALNGVLQRLCEDCGDGIPAGRLAAVPSTSRCVACASKHPSGSPNRRIVETWGTRKDWARDRNSWKRTH